MDERHEIISFSSTLPLKIFIHNLGAVPKHWHNSIEILFILSGSVILTMDDQCLSLEPDDVVLINSNSLHELYSESCKIAAFQIKLSDMDILKDYTSFYFDCCSAGDTHNKRYDYLRYLLARMIKDNAEEENTLSSLALTAMLFDELTTHFRGKRTRSQSSTQKHLERLKNIATYIQENFRQGITLAQLAEHEHLSVSYLSRFFTQYFGMSFTDYYNNIRMDYAVNELMTSDESISSIALNNGYTDPRAFVSQFRQRYGELPSIYRRQNTPFYGLPKSTDHINYFTISSVSALSNLASYLNYQSPGQNFNNVSTVGQLENIHIETDFSASEKTFAHNFQQVCCVGTASDILLSEVQDMLRQVQNEIHFKYIKFHGLLCDDMMVYDETDDGTPVLSFTYMDKVMDFLQNIQLRPILQLSFMPRKLASKPNKSVFYVNYNTSAPKDVSKWNYLVEQTLLHLIKRYGLEEVLQWPICVWNEPDLGMEAFSFGDTEVFYEFYRQTYQIVKSVHPDFFWGTPSLSFADDAVKAWDTAFLEYCNSHDCMPEFLNIHYYNDKLDSMQWNVNENHPRPNRLRMEADAFTTHSIFIHDIVNQHFPKKVPIYLTEWNITANHRNLINDTCFKSCYIVKNILDTYNQLDAFGYWSLTDFMRELHPSPLLFHGGMGMFTNNGIPKPPYYAFKFLSKLGDTYLEKGDGYIITKSRNSLRILLYNYEHYNRLFASGELFDMTVTNRYTPFTMEQHKAFHMDIKNVPGSTARIQEHYVSQECGSSFDAWVRMGAPVNMYREEIDHLKQASQPGYYVHTHNISNGHLPLDIQLKPLEVRLIEITFS